jgi:L-glyceraldehyde 3-phosphate reductase
MQGKSLDRDKISPELVETLNQLKVIASGRGQTLAQMSLAWVLRGGRVTTALIGASKPEQVLDCVGAVENLNFTADELSEIDRLSGDQGINLWAASSEIG